MPSTRFKRASAALLPLLCLLISLCAPQAMAQDVPQRASVQRALDALGKSDTLTVSQQADQKFLTDTLSLLDSIEKEHAKAKSQTQRLRSLPSELREISAKLDALTQNNPRMLAALRDGFLRSACFKHGLLQARTHDIDPIWQERHPIA